MVSKADGLSPAPNSHSNSDYKDELVNATYKNNGYEDTERIVVLHSTLDKSKDPGKDEDDKKKELPPVGLFSLFRYSSSCDTTLIIIGTIMAIVSGTSVPGFTIVYGNIIDTLIYYDLSNKNMTNETMTTDEFLHGTAKLCALSAGLGCVFFFCNYIMVCFFNLAADNQAFKIKSLFMASILKQDIGWYDTTETGDFASRITGDLTKIQEGLGEKMGICINYIFSTIFCVGTSFFYSWKLALLTLSFSSIMSFAMAFVSKRCCSLTTFSVGT